MRSRSNVNLIQKRLKSRPRNLCLGNEYYDPVLGQLGQMLVRDRISGCYSIAL